MNSPKKPRSETIYFTTKGEVSEIQFDYDNEGNLYMPDADPNTVRVEKSYSRASGKDKILTSVFTSAASANFEIDKTLRESYAYVYSIDTNSLNFKGTKISICTCYAVPAHLKHYTKEIPFNLLASYLIINPKPEINPECIGWHLVMSHNTNMAFSELNKLAVIVDSEKDSLLQFNQRLRPFYNNCHLKDHVYFVYASDKDKDSLPGQMLKMCHNVSNQIAKKMKEDDINIPSVSNGDQNFDGYVEINPSQK
ncbi:hypothetical protein [uncultured Desulfobacter sp.]|uniref:hypothetical protein n=1 Tax=uncultured Desulfobacter sp. TaxID=240139 RepID=UPI002AA806FA|nr:hypothetical protein [uncultured Desulfobacter sp.]